METLILLLKDNGLVFAFAVVGIMMLVAGGISKTLTKGRFQASAIAIVLGLVLAYFGGQATGGSQGLADVAVFSGLAVLGGSMLRDFAIIATAYGVDIREAGRAGWAGAVSLFVGIFGSFFAGAGVAY